MELIKIGLTKEEIIYVNDARKKKLAQYETDAAKICKLDQLVANEAHLELCLRIARTDRINYEVHLKSLADKIIVLRNMIDHCQY